MLTSIQIQCTIPLKFVAADLQNQIIKSQASTIRTYTSHMRAAIIFGDHDATLGAWAHTLRHPVLLEFLKSQRILGVLSLTIAFHHLRGDYFLDIGFHQHRATFHCRARNVSVPLVNLAFNMCSQAVLAEHAIAPCGRPAMAAVSVPNLDGAVAIADELETDRAGREHCQQLPPSTPSLQPSQDRITIDRHLGDCVRAEVTDQDECSLNNHEHSADGFDVTRWAPEPGLDVIKQFGSPLRIPCISHMSPVGWILQ